MLQHSDVGVRIWHQVHERMDPSLFVLMVQAGGGCEMVRMTFRTTVYPSFDGCLQQGISMYNLKLARNGQEIASLMCS